MRERITLDEALKRGYLYAPIGYNHARGVSIIAPIKVIQRLSSGGLYDVATLDLIRDDQLEPEPTADIPMVTA